jgi:membrane protein YqaA with SNARE-associated domain
MVLSMGKKFRDLAVETEEYMMRPIKRFKETPQYNYLHNLGIGFWVFLIVTFSLGFIFAFYIEGLVAVMISGYGFIGIFFMALLLELVVQPVGPDMVIILGTLAGLHGGAVLAVVLAGSYVALYLAYHIGRKIGTPGIERVVGKNKFEKINWSSGGRWFMLVSATTPIPYIPYLTGVLDFNLRDTILYVAIPRTIRLAIVLGLTYFFGVKLLDLTII